MPHQKTSCISLGGLPNEILLEIASSTRKVPTNGRLLNPWEGKAFYHFQAYRFWSPVLSERDLAHLCQTCRHMHLLLSPLLRHRLVSGEEYRKEGMARWAAKKNLLPLLTSLLDDPAMGVDVNYRRYLDLSGAGCATALDWAAYHGNTEMIEELLARGAILDPIPERPYMSYSGFISDTTRTALWVAVYAHQVDAARLLLNKGADIHRRIYNRAIRKTNQDGETMLSLAVLRQCKPMIEMLLDHGANIHERVSGDTERSEYYYHAKNKTILAQAVGTGNKDIVQLLLSRGAGKDMSALEYIFTNISTFSVFAIASCVSKVLNINSRERERC